MRGAAVWCCIHHPRRNSSLLCELLDGRGLLDDVVGNRRELTGLVGTQTNALDRRRAIADAREHLLPGECQLHRPPRCLSRHYRENHLWVSVGLGTESTTDIRRDNTDA